jgi:hypothetical protein
MERLCGDMKREIERLASRLEERPRDEDDLLAAKRLRELIAVYEVAREMVLARTHEHSKAAYCEMIDLIKGKRGV